MSKYNIIKDIATVKIRQNYCSKEVLESIEEDLYGLSLKMAWSRSNEDSLKEKHDLKKKEFESLSEIRHEILNTFIKDLADRQLVIFSYDEADLLFE